MLTDIQLRETHGIAMATTWGVSALMGAFIARYCRQYSWWLTAHRACVSVGAFFTLPLTFLAFFSHLDEHYETYHGRLGISVASLSLCQGFLGTLLFGRMGMGPCSRTTPSCCNLDGTARAGRRRYVARLHRFIGWVLVVLAFTTLFFGIWAFSCETHCRVISEITYVYFGYIAMLVIPLLCLEIRHRRLQRIVHIQVPSTPNASMDGLQPMLGAFVESVNGLEDHPG